MCIDGYVNTCRDHICNRKGPKFLMKNIHFIGVSGIGVSAVARIAMESGMYISGSAIEENELTAGLQKRGMAFHLGHKPEYLGNPDAVVKSAAVPESNPEVKEARKRGIPVYLYSQYLGMLMSIRQGIAVAGTHGKTTTTAMLARIFSDAGLNPAVVCGGVMSDFSSNALHGGGEYFIAEACEFNRSFLHLKKRYSIVTNIEPDHLDYYRDIDDIKTAFGDFLYSTDSRGFSVINGDDLNVTDILKAEPDAIGRCINVGEAESNEFRISRIRSTNGRYSFDLTENRQTLLSIDLSMPGRFNCMNAALASVCSFRIGIDAECICQALKTFKGIERRFELLGQIYGCPVYSDYAHHPTEIRVTIATLRQMYPSKKIITVFQPHQYSRTRLLFDGFVSALNTADGILLTDIYRQRDNEQYAASVSGRDLYTGLKKSRGGSVWFVEEKEDIPGFIKRMQFGDAVLVFMGAGDIDVVARDCVRLFS